MKLSHSAAKAAANIVTEYQTLERELRCAGWNDDDVVDKAMPAIASKLGIETSLVASVMTIHWCGGFRAS